MYLEMERIIINNLCPEDLQFLTDLDSDPLVRKFNDGKVQTIDETRQYLSENIDGYLRHGFGRYAVRVKESLKPIGICGFLMENYGVDFGYRFIQSAWGQRIVQDAGNTVVRYGVDQLKLKKIVGIVLPDNIASEKVLISCGFTFVGMDKVWGKEIKKYEITH